MALSPNERVLRARIAAHAQHAQGRTNTLPATDASPARREYFDRLVDPEGVLPDAERARRAEHARSAHFNRLALASAKARRERSLANTSGALRARSTGTS
jgi:hypothetical protein